MSDLESITTEESNNQNLAKRLINFGSNYIDYRMGALGAGVMGAVVFGINYEDSHQLIEPTIAALKQASYTFFLGGAVMKSCGYLATKLKKKTAALAAAIIIPSAATIAMTYAVHNMKGTPRPLESTIPTLVLSIPSTAIVGYRRRKQYEFNLEDA